MQIRVSTFIILCVGIFLAGILFSAITVSTGKAAETKDAHEQSRPEPNRQSYQPYKLHTMWGIVEDNTIFKFRDYDNDCYIVTGKSYSASWINGNASTSSTFTSAPLAMSCVKVSK